MLSGVSLLSGCVFYLIGEDFDSVGTFQTPQLVGSSPYCSLKVLIMSLTSHRLRLGSEGW